jgi:hypothetical protein
VCPAPARHGRVARRRKGLPTWRLVQYADFVVLVHGQRGDAEALREVTARVLEPLGLRLSPAKTQIVHMSEAFDFLGFRVQWKRKRGTSKWYVYTFIAARDALSMICHEGLAKAIRGCGHVVRRKRSRLTIPSRLYSDTRPDPGVPLELSQVDVYQDAARRRCCRSSHPQGFSACHRCDLDRVMS